MAALLPREHGRQIPKFRFDFRRIGYSIRDFLAEEFAAPLAKPVNKSKPSRQPSAMPKANGRATHKLKQLKQSIIWPQNPEPTAVRSRRIRSQGPSSLASRCVIRQTASAPSRSQ